MLEDKKKARSITGWQVLLLLTYGLAVGYPCCQHLGRWDGNVSRYQDLYRIGGFTATTALIAGCIGIAILLVRVITKRSY